jgi:uncharacterized protein YndB with AHSA1/START domain
MKELQIKAEPGTPFIEVTREFDAPRELIFRAHVEPDLVRQWMGPAKYEMTIHTWEVRDGGAWRFTQRDASGNEFGFHGVFHGTPTPDNMVQTFEFEGAPGHVELDTLRMEEHDGRTIVRVESVHQSVEARDAMLNGGMTTGVEEGYRRLDALLASLTQPVG